MNMELRWLASRLASSLCAAEAIVKQRPAADAAMAEALTAPTATFVDCCGSAGVEPEALLAHLIPLSAGIEVAGQLAEVALAKVLGRDESAPFVTSLADALRQLDAALLGCRPQIVDELALRGGPLCEQWQARGPGLLAAIGRLTEPAVLISQADVVLVHPFLGGHGQAWLLYNSVTLEAVLANPHADLPEVVRLGWLLAQLNLEVPALSELIEPHRLSRIGSLAMLCVALSAAEEVELATLSQRTIARAIDAWRLDAGASVSANLAVWWQTYLASRPRWPAALAALDRMLE